MTALSLVLQFYTKNDCPLCDAAHEALDRVLSKLDAVPVEVQRVDIERDPAVYHQYQWLIPVIELDGARLAIYRVNERKLTKRLKREWNARR